MAYLTKNALEAAVYVIKNYDESVVEDIIKMEERVDKYEDELGAYLLKLSSKNLSVKESRIVSEILHCIGDYERISDHALNICEAAKEMNEKNLSFSDEAKDEFETFTNAVRDILATAIDAFVEEDSEKAKTVEPLEEVIDKLNVELKKRHVKRLREGKCTIEMGFILSDLTTNFERVADHASNLAVAVIQLQEDGLESHEYLDSLDKGENTRFRELYKEYKAKYGLKPINAAE